MKSKRSGKKLKWKNIKEETLFAYGVLAAPYEPKMMFFYAGIIEKFAFDYENKKFGHTSFAVTYST
jgi:hypothetical protein